MDDITKRIKTELDLLVSEYNNQKEIQGQILLYTFTGTPERRRKEALRKYTLRIKHLTKAYYTKGELLSFQRSSNEIKKKT